MFRSVQLFKALADETRLRILNLLAHGELCVCEIEQVLEIGQSKASRHLAYLRNVGFVTDRREGPWMYYSVSKPEGTAHQMALRWLAKAHDEIPQAAADLEALDDLRKRGGVCGPCSGNGRNNRRPKAAVTKC